MMAEDERLRGQGNHGRRSEQDIMQVDIEGARSIVSGR